MFITLENSDFTEEKADVTTINGQVDIIYHLMLFTKNVTSVVFLPQTLNLEIKHEEIRNTPK
jgi:hypothetical protein